MIICSKCLLYICKWCAQPSHFPQLLGVCGTSTPVTMATLSLCLMVGFESCMHVFLCECSVRERSSSPRQSTGSNWYGLSERKNTYSNWILNVKCLISLHSHASPKSEDILKPNPSLLKTIFWRGGKNKTWTVWSWGCSEFKLFVCSS